MSVFGGAPTYTLGGAGVAPSPFGGAPTYTVGNPGGAYGGTYSTPPQPTGQPRALPGTTVSAPSIPLYGAPERNPEPFATRLLYDQYSNEPQGYARVGNYGKKQQGPLAPSPVQAQIAGTPADPILQNATQQQAYEQQQQLLFLQQQQQQVLQQQQAVTAHQMSANTPQWDPTSSVIPTVAQPGFGYPGTAVGYPPQAGAFFGGGAPYGGNPYGGAFGGFPNGFNGGYGQYGGYPAFAGF